MKRLLGVAALASAIGWAGAANAGPLKPSLDINPDGTFVGGITAANGNSCIAGEGAAPNFQRGETVDGVFIGAGAVQHVDWIVCFDGNANGGYTYYYQLENSSIFFVNAFNIGGANQPPFGFADGTEGSVDTDLDTDAGSPVGTGHTGTANGGAFANLGDETAAHSPFPAVNETEVTGGGAALVCCTNPASVEVGSLFITFSGAGGNEGFLAVGGESGVIFVQGTAPVYGNWNTTGAGSQGTPVSWGSAMQTQCSAGGLAQNGGVCPFSGAELGVQIPVPGNPLPEPETLSLFGLALLGLGAWTRRRNRQA